MDESDRGRRSSCLKKSSGPARCAAKAGAKNSDPPKRTPWGRLFRVERGFRSDPAVVQEGAELQQRLDRGRGDLPMLIEHHALGRVVATQQRPDQQAVMLIELLQGLVRSPMQFDESLLAAAAEK